MKKEVFSVLNPILKRIVPQHWVERRLQRLCSTEGIKHLDLGGAHCVEGYAVLHLSVIEPYGIPLRRIWDNVSEFDEFTHKSVTRRISLTHAVSLNVDVSKRLPFADSSLLGVNMSHFLEHFEPSDGLQILKEVNRVLAPGGIVRISCPDLRKYAQAYLRGDAAFFEHPAIMFHYQYPELSVLGDKFISKAYDGSNHHKWFFDAETCIDLLRRAGLGGAVQRQLHDSGLPRIQDIEPKAREHESFYVEAVKPGSLS